MRWQQPQFVCQWAAHSPSVLARYIWTRAQYWRWQFLPSMAGLAFIALEAQLGAGLIAPQALPRILSILLIWLLCPILWLRYARFCHRYVQAAKDEPAQQALLKLYHAVQCYAWLMLLAMLFFPVLLLSLTGIF